MILIKSILEEDKNGWALTNVIRLNNGKKIKLSQMINIEDWNV